MENLRTIIVVIFLIALIGCENNGAVSEATGTGEMRVYDEEQPRWRGFAIRDVDHFPRCPISVAAQVLLVIPILTTIKI